MSLPKYYNIYKKSNQGTTWKRQVIFSSSSSSKKVLGPILSIVSFSLWHVCVTEIYPYAMTSTCTLLLVIHVRYDSSTCDIKFLRINYSPCIKQSSLLKFWKAGLSWNGLFPFIGIHYEAWLTWLTAIFIRASRWYAVSILRKQLNKSYCSWNDRITVKKWYRSFPVCKNTINSVKVQLSNENRQQKIYFWIMHCGLCFTHYHFKANSHFNTNYFFKV